MGVNIPQPVTSGGSSRSSSVTSSNDTSSSDGSNSRVYSWASSSSVVSDISLKGIDFVAVAVTFVKRYYSFVADRIRSHICGGGRVDFVFVIGEPKARMGWWGGASVSYTFSLRW